MHSTSSLRHPTFNGWMDSANGQENFPEGKVQQQWTSTRGRYALVLEHSNQQLWVLSCRAASWNWIEILLNQLIQMYAPKDKTSKIYNHSNQSQKWLREDKNVHFQLWKPDIMNKTDDHTFIVKSQDSNTFKWNRHHLRGTRESFVFDMSSDMETWEDHNKTSHIQIPQLPSYLTWMRRRYFPSSLSLRPLHNEKWVDM